MICSKCGNNVNDGIKFCTKCGTKCGADFTGNSKLSYIAAILSIIGIIGMFISNPFLFGLGYIFWQLSIIVIIGGIITSLIAIYKQKNKIAYYAGLISCIYLILITLPNILPFLRFLRYLGMLGWY